MFYTLGEAAKATGKSKSTISKAIKNGKISAQKNESGVYQIDASELNRVYTVNVENKHKETDRTTTVKPINSELNELKLRIEFMQEQINDKNSLITDLKDDRDKWRQQATALLEKPKELKRRWWHWR